tara:strand:- start:2029 stop:2181 length:153 start_codon:yes stop_codon:yes gene_type:complete
MPWKVDPNSGNNEVGYVYTQIARSLSIGLPVGTLLAAILWGSKHGFDHFF